MIDPNAEVRRTIDAAIARRGEVFALSHLALTDAGYTVKFRSGFLDIVQTDVSEGTITDPAAFDKVLDRIRVAFRAYNPVSTRQAQ